jgi:hypothetical protein
MVTPFSGSAKLHLRPDVSLLYRYAAGIMPPPIARLSNLLYI